MTFRVSGRALWSRKTLEESFYGKRTAMLRSDRCGCPRPWLSHSLRPSCTPADDPDPDGSSVVASAWDSWLMLWGCSETGYRQVTSTDMGPGPCEDCLFAVEPPGLAGGGGGMIGCRSDMRAKVQLEGEKEQTGGIQQVG